LRRLGADGAGARVRTGLGRGGAERGRRGVGGVPPHERPEVFANVCRSGRISIARCRRGWASCCGWALRAREDGLQSRPHRQYQRVVHGCRVHAAPATWLRQPCSMSERRCGAERVSAITGVRRERRGITVSARAGEEVSGGFSEWAALLNLSGRAAHSFNSAWYERGF